jgi:tetratricopeptide (TPR) repeat protein
MKPKTPDPDSLAQAALRHQSAGRLDEARKAWECLLAAEPGHNVALYFLALIFEQQKQPARALELLEACAASDTPAPATAQHHAAHAAALGRAQKHKEALAAAERAVALDANLGDAQHTRGIALEKLGREDESIAAFRAAMAASPDHFESLGALGAALMKRADFSEREEAVTLLQKAVKLRPGHVEATSNLGHALRHAGKIGEAIGVFRAAADARPDSADCHNNLGVALQESGQIADAMARFERAAVIRPGYAQARWNLALARLLSGDFARGWAGYEWRKKIEAERGKLPPLAAPEWNGCSVDGLTVLLRAEQGLGDTVQFIRYAKLVQERGATTVVECQPPLVHLLHGVDGIDHVIARGQPLPTYDLQARLLSLPAIFNTTIDSIPAPGGYIRPQPQRVTFWKEKLAAFSGFKVGVCWQGSSAYSGDTFRSIPLRHFAPLADIPGVQLFSLQKGLGTKQMEQVAGEFVVHDINPPPDDQSAGSFVDTAAVIASLDLVITSDTSVAHLAGALGAPVWLMLAKIPDWRWMLERLDSPWYSSMRLWRQAERGNWPELFEYAAAALREKVGASPVVPRILAPVSPGELIDRITILTIKSERIDSPSKLANVRRELEELRNVASTNLPTSRELDALTARLAETNAALWDIEDSIRDCEAEEALGKEFIALARAVPKCNHERSRIKAEINRLLGSVLIDEKVYGSRGRGEGGFLDAF